MDDDRPRYRGSLEQRKEDLLDKLVAEMRERGVEANVDPRMDFEQAGIAFLTFYGGCRRTRARFGGDLLGRAPALCYARGSLTDIADDDEDEGRPAVIRVHYDFAVATYCCRTAAKGS